jgi:hypothetical protein
MKAIKICLVRVFLVAQLFLSSCDNRKDYLIEINKAPILTLVKNGVELTGNTLSDSLKIGEPFSLHYFISDEEKIIITKLCLISFDAKVIINGFIIKHFG